MVECHPSKLEVAGSIPVSRSILCYNTPMRDLFLFYIRFPVMSLWFKWKHRHETPEQREQRVSETKKRFRDIYDSIRETVPESKGVMEANEWLDPLMDELLGKK
jgi:hypothetical protein